MTTTIKISEALHQRLATYREGFETEEQVIEKILNFYEEKSHSKSTTPTIPLAVHTMNMPTEIEIVYYPNNSVDDFKKELLANKQAYIKLHYTDGTSDTKTWNASNFKDSSNVKGNLQSGYLRGWRKKGIFKAELSVNKLDF